jgi:hypothetical protein
VNQFNAREFPGADFLATEFCDTAREFRAVQVANANDFAF